MKSAQITPINIQHAETISTNTFNAQSVIQVENYNGRTVTFPASSVVINIPGPLAVPTASPQPKDKLPLYSLTSPSSQGVFDSTQLANVTSIIAIKELSHENRLRRDFFFQLKNEIQKWDDYGYHYVKLYTQEGAFYGEVEGTCADCLLGCFTCGLNESPEEKKQKDQRQVSLPTFASRIALGLVYQYQDQIPLLMEHSFHNLITSFSNAIMQSISVTLCESKRWVPTYEILMALSKYNYFSAAMGNVTTTSGHTIPIKNLFSLGVRTVDGGLYEPQENKSKKLFEEMKSLNFPLYRWGTKEGANSEFMPMYGIDPDWNGTRHAKTLPINYAANYDVPGRYDLKLKGVGVEGESYSREPEFWKEAEKLAKQYLRSEEINIK